MNIMKVGIVGNGFVGQATRLFANDSTDILVYDILPDKCIPHGLKLEDLSICQLIFVCVPTPMNNDGSCNTSIVENVVSKLKNCVNTNETFIVLRSTVPPGTSDKLGVYFSPEFLTEKNWRNDFVSTENWIFGYPGCACSTRFSNVIYNLMQNATNIRSKETIFIKNIEAETIKYFRNSFLAMKVSFCNEIEEFCSKNNIDYDTVRYCATLDKRIGDSHSLVPGHDNKRGYGGTCLPKDTNALLFEMKKIGMESYIIDAVIKRNEIVDRPEKDWQLDKGRAVI